VDTKQRIRLPEQNSGHHDELAELAAILSAEAKVRHATLTIVRHESDDLAPTIVIRARNSHRGWRVGGAVVLAFAAAGVASLALGLLHSSSPAPAPVTRPVAAASTAAPTSPATWGAAARQRLGAGGRPVSVFGCMGAYDVDAPQSSGMLPVAYQGTPEFSAYMGACVSDMSGQPATPNELAH